jgi:hypothetical protein
MAGQRAPFFEVDAERFGFIRVDTGILRRRDADQFHWLRTTLEWAKKRSRQGRGYGIVGHFSFRGRNLSPPRVSWNSVRVAAATRGEQ